MIEGGDDGGGDVYGGGDNDYDGDNNIYDYDNSTSPHLH